jgi:hypothetical protein
MALKSTSCSILLHRGSQPGDLRSCTYVISFPGPHSELPVSLFAPVRTSRPAQQTCPSACPCPGSSLRDFAPRCSFVWGCQMRCGASVTCAPLRRRQIACFSRACPYPAAALLCHLGPLLHFRKSALGCCQPPPAGGPLAADLSNCTRRAGRQHPAPPGPTRCRGAQESAHCPARGPAHRSVGRAVRSCSCSWVAAGQARCGRPGTNARPLLRAGAACIAPCKPVASDRRLGARPRQNGSCRYVRYRSTDCARLTARVLCATKHDNCAGASVA